MMTKLRKERLEAIEAARLEAIEAALNAALAGDFDGGDFEGMDRKEFERALDWVWEQQAVRRERGR